MCLQFLAPSPCCGHGAWHPTLLALYFANFVILAPLVINFVYGADMGSVLENDFLTPPHRVGWARGPSAAATG